MKELQTFSVIKRTTEKDKYFANIDALSLERRNLFLMFFYMGRIKNQRNLKVFFNI